MGASANVASILGFTKQEFSKYLEIKPVPSPQPELISQNSVSKPVPLYFDEPTHARFTEKIRAICSKHGIETVSGAVMMLVDSYEL